MDKDSRTPSLVGISVRSINDSENPDFNEEKRPGMGRSSSQLLEKISSSSQVSKLDSAYTSVDELNREGALLTDDNEVDLDNVVHGKLHEADDLKKSLLRKNRRPRQNPKNVPGDSSSSVSVASSSYSPSQSRSSSLVTSTDPVVQGSVAKARAGGNFNLSARDSDASFSGHKSEDKIRNSYGEFIANKSHRPHLAGGESYQSTKHGDTESPTERSGRTSRKEDASRGFLRSLSRSLSRDPKKVQEREQLEDAVMYSTNNYSISRIDLENAPHVIKEEIEEEQDQGALLNDEGDERYSADLQEAASDKVQKL
ncbi:LADA_0H15126g1_1 [Lachancea dasiensis]|uniref:LADA_0H15126g1_1 n=1 Tax=Lachancea dasiensis TaxID=1072105 RepID=A0A1G4K4R6_9SACH|nr:LADA_0H15126g1_1 [Lachancea dasiensis]